jgi:mRNA interferase MazF
MARFVKGDVVVVPFPFTNLTDAKRRPALVIASLSGDDVILCQITSQIRRDSDAIALENNDFRIGSLRKSSNIRPNRIFTADRQIIQSKVGELHAEKLEAVLDRLITILRR